MDEASENCSTILPDPLSLLNAEVRSLRNLEYPHIGDGENKISNAYLDDLKTVGYGRKKKHNYVTYNNPFDPRLTFNGLTHVFSCGDVNNVKKTDEQLAENVFLALENGSEVMDNYLNGFRQYLNDLIQPPTIDLDSNVTKVTLRRCNSGRKGKLISELPIDDDGTDECKDLFERIKSDIVRSLFDDDEDETPSKKEDATDQKIPTNQSDLSHDSPGERNDCSKQGEENDHMILKKTGKRRQCHLSKTAPNVKSTHGWNGSCWSGDVHTTKANNIPTDERKPTVVKAQNKIQSTEQIFSPAITETTDCQVVTQVCAKEDQTVEPRTEGPKLSSSSTIEVTSQTFPPLGSQGDVHRTGTTSQKQQPLLSDNWAERLFKRDSTKNEDREFQNIPEGEETVHTESSPVESRLSPTSKPFVPTSQRDLPSHEDINPQREATELTNEKNVDETEVVRGNDVTIAPQGVPQANCQTQPVPAAPTQPESSPFLNYNTYQSNTSQPVRQQSPYHSAFWNQQRRLGYGVQTGYSANYFNLHQPQKWSTSEASAYTSSQYFGSQLQSAEQSQQVTPPPGFPSGSSCQNSQISQSTPTLRFPLFQTTHLDPAIQAFSRQIECNRVAEQQHQPPYPFSVLSTIALPPRYSQTQPPQQLLHNIRQPCFQAQIGQIQQQILNNYRANWAPYNTNNNFNNHFILNNNNNNNNNSDLEKEEDVAETPIIHMSGSSIESIESDLNRESSSKEKARLKPRPTRSNLIQIIPTED